MAALHGGLRNDGGPAGVRNQQPAAMCAAGWEDGECKPGVGGVFPASGDVLQGWEVD